MKLVKLIRNAKHSKVKSSSVPSTETKLYLYEMRNLHSFTSNLVKKCCKKHCCLQIVLFNYIININIFYLYLLIL